jgi:hypothetical protein
VHSAGQSLPVGLQHSFSAHSGVLVAGTDTLQPLEHCSGQVLLMWFHVLLVHFLQERVVGILQYKDIPLSVMPKVTLSLCCKFGISYCS